MSEQRYLRAVQVRILLIINVLFSNLVLVNESHPEFVLVHEIVSSSHKSLRGLPHMTALLL